MAEFPVVYVSKWQRIASHQKQKTTVFFAFRTLGLANGVIRAKVVDLLLLAAWHCAVSSFQCNSGVLLKHMLL